MQLTLYKLQKKAFFFLLARELMLRPAPAPAARDWRAPKDAMGFTEELVLEVGEEPAV